MSRTVFYCRCGARIEGSEARLYHRCQQTPPPEVVSDTDVERDAEAEGDPSIRDLETTCAWCGLAHYKESEKRDCPCSRHIGGGVEHASPCNAARVV